MSERPPMRATTYAVVAKHGDCPKCGKVDVDLRFVYNPYSDDELACVECGITINSYYTEHGIQ